MSSRRIALLVAIEKHGTQLTLSQPTLTTRRKSEIINISTFYCAHQTYTQHTTMAKSEEQKRKLFSLLVQFSSLKKLL